MSRAYKNRKANIAALRRLVTTAFEQLNNRIIENPYRQHDKDLPKLMLLVDTRGIRGRPPFIGIAEDKYEEMLDADTKAVEALRSLDVRWK